MSTLSYPQLLAGCEPGGATALSLVTELAPAGGPHCGVAPASVDGRNRATVGCQTRLIDGQAATVVIIDDTPGQLARVEAAILQSIGDEHPLLSRVPRVRVSYGRLGCTDLELPQRIFDSQILAGTVGGSPITAHPSYRAARDCSAADARVLLELSPGSLVFGACDSTGKTAQPRYRTALAGEIIGVLTDRPGCASDGNEEAAIGFSLPRLPDSGVVSCRRIIRTQVLNFAVLRQLRFDSGPAGDAACRALLAAYALAGLVRSNAELTIRTDCDLVEAGRTSLKLDARDGDFVVLDAPAVQETDALLARALEEAQREADIHWQGQVFEVTGDPAARAAVVAEQADGAGASGHPPRPFWRTHLVTGRGR